MFSRVTVIPAFKWHSTGYEEAIGSIFPIVKALRVTPFHGMTNILLKSKKVAVVNVVEPTICCIEVGRAVGPNHTTTIAKQTKWWPQKTGELLASMYQFGTFNYINHLNNVPEASVSFSVYGILAIPTLASILFKMVVNEHGCHVQLLYEGSSIELGTVLEEVAGLIV